MGLFDFFTDDSLAAKAITLGDGATCWLTSDDIPYNGVAFIAAGVKKRWPTVVHYDVNDGKYVIEFRGGLTVRANADNVVDTSIETYTNPCGCTRLNAQQAFAKPGIEKDVKKTIEVAEDLLWSHDLAESIRGSDERVEIDETRLLVLYASMLNGFETCRHYFSRKLLAGKSEESAEIEGKTSVAQNGKRPSTAPAELIAIDPQFGKLWELENKIRECLEEQFSRVGQEASGKDISFALKVLGSDCGGGVVAQKKKYEEESASRRYDEDLNPAAQEAIKSILLSRENGNEVFGSPAWSKERKTIVCTDQPMAPSAFSKRKRLDGIMVMDAADIELYNEGAEEGEKLLFPASHPQNGCTYIQHPLQANLYFEVNEFHQRLIERKQSELLRILQSLGAYSAKVEVSHEQREDARHEKELQVGAKVAYGEIEGTAAYSGSESRQSMSALAQRLSRACHWNPKGKPTLPDNLVFYHTEESWKDLATSVLQGRTKREEAVFEYKTEYGITEKHLSDISIAVKAVLPSFEMNLKSSFSSDLHWMTSTTWRYDVVFEDEEGRLAGDSADTVADAPTPPPLPAPGPTVVSAVAPVGVDVEKAEALFRKRAKRYAQSEGHVNAEQRADLEAFAQKYGIDEFRMEELIEEAFE